MVLSFLQHAECTAKVNEIEHNLGTLLSDLNLANQLIYLAYIAVKGTKLAGRLAKRQAELATLSAESSTTMESLFDGSSESRSTLVFHAYQFLRKGDKGRALQLIGKSGDHAQVMARHCSQMADRFQGLVAKTHDDIVAVQKAQRDPMRTVGKEQEAAVQEALAVLKKLSTPVRMDKVDTISVASSAVLVLDDVSHRMEALWHKMNSFCENLSNHELGFEIEDGMSAAGITSSRGIQFSARGGIGVNNNINKSAADFDTRWVAVREVSGAFVDKCKGGGSRVSRVLIALDEAVDSGDLTLLANIKPDVKFLVQASKKMRTNYKTASQNASKRFEEASKNLTKKTQEEKALQHQLNQMKANLKAVTLELAASKKDCKEFSQQLKKMHDDRKGAETGNAVSNVLKIIPVYGVYTWIVGDPFEEQVKELTKKINDKKLQLEEAQNKVQPDGVEKDILDGIDAKSQTRPKSGRAGTRQV